jgi:Kef-type K+ transport system membrane component KefB
MNSGLFLVCSIIIILPYLLWSLPFIKRYIPVVVVQMLTGILLGPALLGKLSPELYSNIFDISVLRQLDTVAQVSLVFLGFLIGLRIDADIVQKQDYKKYFAIGLLSVLTPFILSIPVAFLLFTSVKTLTGVSATGITFILSISLAASVTALPVLGAILVENGLIKSIEGKLAVVFASVNDILLWILLVVIIGITSATGSPVDFIQKIVLLISFICILLILIKPLLKRKVTALFPNGEVGNMQLAITVGVLFFCASISELIGLQAILGTFVMGMAIPRSIAEKYYQKLESFVLIILVPFFLTATGLKTNFSAQSSDIWIIFVAITITSVIGNFIGIAVPSYLSGLGRRTSVLLGIFMQCKGLMEIVVLSTFLQAKIISQTAFSGMVLMALFTTAMTQPATKVFLYLEKKRKKKGV